MISMLWTKISDLHRRYRDDEHYHAYYSIPVFAGFLGTYILIQLLVTLFPDFAFHAKGYHIHHYTYGIILLLVFGYIGLWTKSTRMKYFCALAYGIGAAFIIDEAFIWFTLNPADGYQDYDLAFFVGAIFLGVVLAPLLYKRDKLEKE